MAFQPTGESAQVIGLHADVQVTEYTLDTDICTIGRSPCCHIVVLRNVVSRLHARIEREGPRYILRDAGSANGTFVNSQRMYEPHPLKTHDLIGLGAPAPVLRFSDPDPTFEPSNRLRYNKRSLTFFLDAQPLDLTPTQFRLLYHLYQHVGDLSTRESCCEAIWGRDYDPALDSQALDGVVAGVRRQIRQVDPNTNMLQTRRGIGYELLL